MNPCVCKTPRPLTILNPDKRPNRTSESAQATCPVTRLLRSYLMNGQLPGLRISPHIPCHRARNCNPLKKDTISLAEIRYPDFGSVTNSPNSQPPANSRWFGWPTRADERGESTIARPRQRTRRSQRFEQNFLAGAVTSNFVVSAALQVDSAILKGDPVGSRNPGCVTASTEFGLFLCFKVVNNDRLFPRLVSRVHDQIPIVRPTLRFKERLSFVD